MTMYRIKQMVEEIYFIEAETEEDATEILFSGHVEPDTYGKMDITDIEVVQ